MQAPIKLDAGNRDGEVIVDGQRRPCTMEVSFPMCCCTQLLPRCPSNLLSNLSQSSCTQTSEPVMTSSSLSLVTDNSLVSLNFSRKVVSTAINFTSRFTPRVNCTSDEGSSESEYWVGLVILLLLFLYAAASSLFWSHRIRCHPLMNVLNQFEIVRHQVSIAPNLNNVEGLQEHYPTNVGVLPLIFAPILNTDNLGPAPNSIQNDSINAAEQVHFVGINLEVPVRSNVGNKDNHGSEPTVNDDSRGEAYIDDDNCGGIVVNSNSRDTAVNVDVNQLVNDDNHSVVNVDDHDADPYGIHDQQWLAMCIRGGNFYCYDIDPSNVSLRCEFSDDNVPLIELRDHMAQPVQAPLWRNAVFPILPQAPIYYEWGYVGPAVIAHGESQS